MRRTWRSLLPLVILVALVGYLYARQHQAPAPPATADAAVATRASARPPPFLAPEVRATLALIARGGPFPHPQDGEVFGNYEHLLPTAPRGYYHAYTVAAPDARTRGARRIITAGNPPVAYYYTDDHYRSFHRFTVPP